MIDTVTLIVITLVIYLGVRELKYSNQLKREANELKHQQLVILMRLQSELGDTTHAIKAIEHNQKIKLKNTSIN